MNLRMRIVLLSLLAMLLCAGSRSVFAAQVQLLMPLGRTAYQTNEQIDLAVVRQDAQALQAGVLTLTVTGEDASKLTFTFPVKAVPVVGNDARTTERLQVNGWLLRPGSYTVQVACDGATADKSIQLYSHIRKSTYRTVHWWGPTGKDMLPEGEDGMGFNLMIGGTEEPSIRAGMDILGAMLMGGGHQHDLKLANDWSDPYVYLGADQRGVDRAFTFRTMPNAIGAHLHDEPGLTYAVNPHTNEMSPHDIKQQRDAYKHAFGEEQPWVDEINPDKPADMQKWTELTDFRLGFMDAFWKSANTTLSKMKPGYLAITQSQYAWWAMFDGYYFNVARNMPVISGHGGYDDYFLREMNPSNFVEMSLPRQMDKPNWYLPIWGVWASSQVRECDYLCFISGIQGISAPPAGMMNPNSVGAQGCVEVNKAMARLGTIFAKPAYTRQDVAILYSKSNVYHAKIVKGSTMGSLGMVYLALKMQQYPITAVLEEDILDGTLAANHKAVVLTDIQYLAPEVKDGLQAYMQAGGTVLMTDDCTVELPGAVKIGTPYVDYSVQDKAALDKVTDKKEKADLTAKLTNLTTLIERAKPLAKGLKAQLEKRGIMPTFTSTVPTIASGKQVRGDIEYDFAVNFTTNGTPTATASTISLPNDGRPVYDAMRGGLMTFAKKGQAISAPFRFGPGQMRVFARPIRPIGGVLVATPAVIREYTRDSDPLTLEIATTLVDTQNQVLSGAAPLQIIVTDPLGGVRYNLYRATEQGMLKLSLPLAINDPAGKWTVTVKELLNNSAGNANFTLQAVPQCGAAAGKGRRAVYFWADKENIYQFFRNQRTLTIVKGNSDYCAAAADRLVTALGPYNVRCTIVNAADANKARELTAEEAKTWCGDAAAGDLKVGNGNDPASAGYDVPGPSILLGNAQDNPLIAFLQNKKVLPYPVSADFPGRGHGMLAWNALTLGHDLESVAVIANDAEGLNEAVGTLFELAVGLEPLTPNILPSTNAVAAATRLPAQAPAATIAWQTAAPDTIGALALDGANVTAISLDGSLTTIDGKGKLLSSKTDVKAPDEVKPSKDVSKLPKDKLLANLAVKQVVAGAAGTAVAYWGGTLQIFAADGTLKTQQMLPQDITAMLWTGNTLIAGLAEGNILGLTAK